MQRSRRRLLLLGAAVLCTLAAGTLGYHLIEGWPLFDAFYMSLTTVATVGYMEIHPLSTVGRIFNSGLIAVGVTIIFLSIGAVTQAVVEAEFGEVFTRRKYKRMIDKIENHYLICGFGRVGRGAAGEFQHAGVPFVVVDRSPEKVERAIRLGMLAVQADSTRDETLRDLRIEKARGLVAALATDADNLFLILSAKTLNPGIRISARAGEEEAENKLRRAGADAVFAPYHVTGHRLAQSVLRPHVQEFLDIFTGQLGKDIVMEQVRVDEASEAAAKSLQDLQLRREVGVIVLAIRRASGRMEFNPPASAALAGGDFLVVMGERASLHKLEKLLTGVAR